MMRCLPELSILDTAKPSRLRRVSSRQNALVKDLRRCLARGEPTEDGAIAIEGRHIIEEAIRSGLKLRAVFFSESAQSQAQVQRLLPQVGARVEVLLLPDEVFASATATESPQGVAALVEPRVFTLEQLLGGREPLLLCAIGVQDPGNLGTMLRSAEAFAAGGALLGEGTVSAFNSKVVRASAGSVFRLPILAVKMSEAIGQLRGQGARVLATSSHKGTPLPEANLTGQLAVLIGNEGAGVPRELLEMADETVAIPHSKKVDSLNAGVAASLILYEAARQRKMFSSPT
jgi:RNA methyltransferase, TrmH family